MKRFIFIILAFFIVGCYSTRVETNPTPKGYLNYIESSKRIDKEKRAIAKMHKKQKKRIQKLQQLDRDVQDR